MKILWLFAALCIAYVFLSSLGSNTKSLADLPSVDVHDLPAGSFKYVSHPESIALPVPVVSILFIRTRDNQLFAYYIQTRDRYALVPEAGPWQSGPVCAHFQPNFETTEIACMDNPPVDEYVKKHRWSLQGKNLSQTAPDLTRVQGKEESGRFVLFKRGF